MILLLFISLNFAAKLYTALLVYLYKQAEAVMLRAKKKFTIRLLLLLLLLFVVITIISFIRFNSKALHSLVSVSLQKGGNSNAESKEEAYQYYQSTLDVIQGPGKVRHLFIELIVSRTIFDVFKAQH